MAEGGRSTPSFHTMQSPQVGGGCASSFFQLFQRNSSKRRFSLTSKRLPAGTTDEEGKRKGFPMPVAAENAQKTTSSDSRAPSPMVVCNKKVPGVVARLMGLESLPLRKNDATRQKKSSQRWSKESELSIHQDTSSRGAWDIVQQQQQPPLPERKDEKQLSIVSSHRSSSSPRQLCPALLPSKSHNQIITPSPLRSPSAHKGTARLLEAAAKILEPNMQPCIRPHRASSSSSSSHGRKPPSPSPPPPPPPIVHSAVVGDSRGKNGISSRSGERMLPPSNAKNGKADQRRPIENPVVVVSSVPNTLFASSELPSQSTSKSRSKDEVLTRDLQQQQQQPSRSLLASPTEEATIPCQTVILPNNRKPAPNGGKRATKVLSEKLVKLDKEAIFPKHRVFPAVESAAKANSSSAHGAQRQQGQGAHDRFRSALRRKSSPPRAPSRCSGKSIVDTMVAVNPKATMLRTTKTSTPPEIHQCNKIPDQQLLLETGDGRATEDALNQNTPVEFNGGCSAESPTDSNTDRFRGSTLDTAVISSVKLEMSVGSIIPMHRRMRSIDEVLSELPVDSDVRACPLADTCTGDATSVSCPQKEPKMQLFTEGSDDLRIEDETEQWRRSLLLMGSIPESQAYSNMVDSAHDLFVSGDSLETGTWSTPSVAGGSADCTPERHKHTLHSSTPSTTTGEEEASEGLTPILHKWFLESSNGSAMGIGEGEQPSPVSILDSPFQDEVSITPEPSLAESDRHLDEVLELHNMCGVLGIQPSSQLDEIDVVKARDTQQESSKHSGGSNLPTEEIADIRENEKIRQAILEISKFQTADLHDRLGKSQPARADEEQSFVHGILKAAQFLSHNNEDESSLKWFAPGLPLDPSLFDRLESGDTEQISIGAGGGGGGGNLNLAQMSTHCQYGALWRCDRKLLFDSINEALVTEIGYGGEPKQPWMVNDNILVGPNPTLRPPGGCSNKLVEDIYRTISKWRELASNAIDSLIDMDMNKCCRLGKWRYYEHEIRDISLEIASMLLGMILDEFVTDLAAAPAATLLLENWQAS
ncbi:unnamed protein product [Sphagnum jensenii]|uniref:DUF4378 domain-containing protein n=1 Tax=Sphagnum jensenii TaxID=128206 RepID=A0ABP0X2S3_9BRYO